MRVLSLLILTAVTAIANAAVIGEMRPAIPLAKDVEGKTPTRASSMQTRAAMEAREVLEGRERNNCNQFCWKDSECLGRCSYCNPDYGKCLEPTEEDKKKIAKKKKEEKEEAEQKKRESDYEKKRKEKWDKMYQAMQDDIQARLRHASPVETDRLLLESVMLQMVQSEGQPPPKWKEWHEH